MEQKFHYGDKVFIGDMPDCMSHFVHNCEAFVVSSYHEQFGGGDIEKYTLYIPKRGEVSWYYEYQLSLLSSDGGVELNNLEEDDKKQDTELKTLPRMIEEYKKTKVLPGVSLQELADRIGFGSLWGSRGEGITCYVNSCKILNLFEDSLESGKVEKIEDRIKELKREL